MAATETTANTRPARRGRPAPAVAATADSATPATPATVAAETDNRLGINLVHTGDTKGNLMKWEPDKAAQTGGVRGTLYCPKGTTEVKVLVIRA